MPRARIITAAVVLAAALALATGCSSGDPGPLPPAPVTPAPASGQPNYAADVQQRVEQAMRANAIPGAVVLIRSRDRGDWSGTFGTGTLGQQAPLSPADHFRVGSNTKTMTVTVILQLLQEGRLRLDDPISQYVPGVPNGNQITLAQLAEMRSGLFSYTFDRGFNETLDRDPGKAWAPRELLAIGFGHPVNFAPGAQFEYCNTNTVLLGLVVEKVTGMPAARAFQERIFTPLALTQTSLPAATDAAIADPHPRGYMFGTNVATIDSSELPPADQSAAVAGTLRPADHTDDNPSWGWTAGAAISTVGDLATYGKALVGGGLLDPATQKLRLDSIRPTNPDQPAAAGYGLGIARFGPLLGHDGQLPGFMTFMGHDPATDTTIVIAANLSAVPSGEGAALTLLKAILPVLYPGTAVPGGDPAAAPKPN
jgi:D-alanyl-D-alanine carboxypeptidase